MIKGKGTRGQIIQWSKAKEQADKQYNDQRKRDKRTNNTITKGKGTIGQIIQWSKEKGQEDK
jgi:ribosomal protein L3